MLALLPLKFTYILLVVLALTLVCACVLYGIYDAGSVSGDREVLCAFFNCTNNAKKGVRTPVWDRIKGLTSSVAHQDGWKCKDGWKSSRPMGEWYGVTTNAAGRVVGLDLQDNFISGTTAW